MAEPLSIAASAIQVAGAGLKLANTLKSYIDSVRKAEKQLKPIADHVKLTSDVLTNVGSLLKNDAIRSLYTKELLGSTNNALDGCRTAFEDLEKFISKFLKPNESAKVSIQASARFTFYFKQKELDILQAHLERFKSSLDLVLGVLNLASSARAAKDTSVIADMKLDIQRLIKAEYDAKAKEATLVSSTPEPDLSTKPAGGESTKELSVASSTARELHSATATPAVRNTFIALGASGAESGAESGEPAHSTTSTHATSSPEDKVLEYLTQCAEATARLMADIEEAIAKWHEAREYRPRCLAEAYYSSAAAITALIEYESQMAREKEAPPRYTERSELQQAAVARWPSTEIMDVNYFGRVDMSSENQNSSPMSKFKSTTFIDEPPADDEINGKKERREVNYACLQCRRSHLVCDLETPCGRCVKRNIGHLCHGEPYAPPRDRMRQSYTAPSHISPGLPVSPRPRDRPLNSPMPRALNKNLDGMPMSAEAGTTGLPLSPRAPRQPVPIPPQIPLAFAEPHLARAEGSQQQAQISSLANSAYAEYMQLPPLPPKNQPQTSATYIPGGESFGPRVGIPLKSSPKGGDAHGGGYDAGQGGDPNFKSVIGATNHHTNETQDTLDQHRERGKSRRNASPSERILKDIGVGMQKDDDRGTTATRMERRPSKPITFAGPRMARRSAVGNQGTLRQARERNAQDMDFERDYLIVEKRAVEINAFAHEMAHNEKRSDDRIAAADNYMEEQARKDRELSRREREAEELEDQREQERAAARDDEAEDIFAQLKTPALGPGAAEPGSGYETTASEEGNSSTNEDDIASFISNLESSKDIKFHTTQSGRKDVVVELSKFSQRRDPNDQLADEMSISSPVQASTTPPRRRLSNVPDLSLSSSPSRALEHSPHVRSRLPTCPVEETGSPKFPEAQDEDADDELPFIFSNDNIESLIPESKGASEEHNTVEKQVTRPTKTGRRRGRLADAKVPCDDCISRVSAKNDEDASIELCEKCTATLHRPRRQQLEQPTLKHTHVDYSALKDVPARPKTTHLASIDIDYMSPAEPSPDLEAPRLKRSYTESALDQFVKEFIDDEVAEAAALEQVNNAIAEEIQKSKENTQEAEQSKEAANLFTPTHGSPTRSHRTSEQQVSPPQYDYAGSDSSILDRVTSAAFEAPNDAALFNFEISDLHFGSHYGALEPGMSQAGPSLEEAPELAESGGIPSIDGSLSSASRSRSRSVSPKQLAGPVGVAAVAALAGNDLRNKNENETVSSTNEFPRRRSRSRRRQGSPDSWLSEDDNHRDPTHRNRRIAQAGLASASAAAAGIWERARSKSRGGKDQQRSKSRVRQGIPIASAGLGGAALAGLWEKNKASKEDRRNKALEDELGRGRYRNRSRSGGWRDNTSSHYSSDDNSIDVRDVQHENVNAGLDNGNALKTQQLAEGTDTALPSADELLAQWTTLQI